MFYILKKTKDYTEEVRKFGLAVQDIAKLNNPNSCSAPTNDDKKDESAPAH